MTEEHAGSDDPDAKHVVGYHGTTFMRARQILDEGFRGRNRGGQWLGPGLAYFFQDGPNRALRWAVNEVVPRVQNLEPELGVQKPAVLRAEIEVNAFWIDLLDYGPWQDILRGMYSELTRLGQAPAQSEPVNASVPHLLDDAVFRLLDATLKRADFIIQGIRAPFIEGAPLYPESAIFEGGHVAIVVRDKAALRPLEFYDPEVSDRPSERPGAVSRPFA